MTVSITFFAQFTKTNLGVDDLTVTVDIVKVARADGAQTAVVTGGSASQITAPSKRGGYLYLLTGADPSLYDYLATFITSGDVDLKEVPALYSSGVFASDASGVARANDASGNAIPTAAQINAEVVDCLATDNYAEPTGAPAATDDLVTKIGFLYEALRNKLTITSGSKAFHNDAGTSQWSKTLSDDGTTYTEAEGS